MPNIWAELFQLSYSGPSHHLKAFSSKGFWVRKTLWLVGVSSALALVAVSEAKAALTLNDYAMTSKLLSPPAHLQVNIAGLSEYDKKAWTIEKQDDGTELYTWKKKPEARAAIMRNAAGDVESMTAYKLGVKGAESSGTLIFDKGSLKSYTSCEDQDSVGRVCVTATHDLCQAIRAGNVRPEDMKSMDTNEMRSLAILLTLRGSDHQLENMVKSGNRLGLKTALQTTKGQLIALSNEVAKEVAAKDRAPSSVGAATATAPASASAAAPKLDEKLAQTVLEKSLPRLKQACVDTHFL